MTDTTRRSDDPTAPDTATRARSERPSQAPSRREFPPGKDEPEVDAKPVESGDQDIDTAGMVPGNKATDSKEPGGF